MILLCREIILLIAIFRAIKFSRIISKTVKRTTDVIVSKLPRG